MKMKRQLYEGADLDNIYSSIIALCLTFTIDLSSVLYNVVIITITIVIVNTIMNNNNNILASGDRLYGKGESIWRMEQKCFILPFIGLKYFPLCGFSGTVVFHSYGECKWLFVSESVWKSIA